MKQTFIKSLCLACLMLISVNALADTEVTIGYLKYSLSGNTATVIGYTAELPKDLEVPSTIEYNGLTFSVTTIGNKAFQNSSILETVILPESVTSVGGFWGCKQLKSAILKGAEYIQSNSFYECSSLQWIDLGPRLSKIDQSAFHNCSSLSYLVFPSTLSWIYGSVVGWPFDGCDLIQNAIFLGKYTFSINSNVKKYTLTDIITWANNSFNYTGSAPVYSYTNNLPAGFKPVNEASWPVLDKNAGTYSINIPMTFANDNMSFEVEIPYEYTINPITLKAKVKDATREYGDDNPEFKAEFSGFIKDEDESVLTSKGTYNTLATSKSDIGTYDITLSDAKAKNYVFEYEKGALTITKASLSAMVKKTSKEYGDDNPEFSIEYYGLKNGETEPAWTSAPRIETDATKTSIVGVYPVSASNGVPKNYELDEIVSSTLSITAAPLTIKAKTYIWKLDEDMPELTLTYEGFKNDETSEVLTKQPVVTTTATKDSEPGDYEVSVSGAEAENYSISYVNGILKVIEGDPVTTEDIITIKEIGKTTWCSKYDLDFTNVEGIKAYTATGYNNITKTIWLTRVMEVPAGTGILVKGDAGTYKIPHAEVQSAYANWFVGNLGETISISATDGDKTNYYLSGKDGSFVSVNGNANIGKNKAYLQLPTSVFGGTRSIGISYDDEDGTTSIKNLTPALTEGEGAWYTLQGQRVAKPGKGLYIHNGKKVVIK